MAFSNAYLPPVLSELVEEYGANTFRVKEGKIDVWAYDKKVLENQKEPTDEEAHRRLPYILLGTYDVAPGLWTATMGPYYYKPGRTIFPLIIHKNSFDVRSLPQISLNITPEGLGETTVSNIMVSRHIPRIPAKDESKYHNRYGSKYHNWYGRIMEQTSKSCQDKVLVDYQVADLKDVTDYSLTDVHMQTYIIPNREALIFIFEREGNLEFMVNKAIRIHVKEYIDQPLFDALSGKFPDSIINPGLNIFSIIPFEREYVRYFPLMQGKVNDVKWENEPILEIDIVNKNARLYTPNDIEIEPKFFPLEQLLQNSSIRDEMMKVVQVLRGERYREIERDPMYVRLYTHIMSELEGKNGTIASITIAQDGSYTVTEE